MTDNSNANTLGDLGRLIGQLMNWGIYVLLAVMYQVFFNVSSAQLFESETIKNFYARFQLIIGVFMVFKLAVSILQGIMDPDKFMNPKEGFGNFITRVVISLALLTVIVPINVPDVENANSFEKYLNNDGLLFGTLYSLQDRILSNNTLGRLILGTTDNATTTESDTSGKTEEEIQQEKLAKSSRIFTSTILKAFLKINLLPPEVREDDDDTKRENWYCGTNLGDTGDAAVEAYQRLDVDPTTLLSWDVLTADCEVNESAFDYIQNAASWIPIFGGFIENTRYVFAFNWLISAIVGIVFLVILVGFTIDIAIRSIKLAILRLLAPIPIISYIEPKSSKDGMFASWVKALTSTYLDLFLRLAIVYFVIFLIQDMIENGIVITEVGGLVGAFSFVFIMLGLFFFAKMAPKFIKDILGLKGLGMSNFGLGGMAAFAGAIRQGGTFAEAMEAASDDGRVRTQAYNQGKQAPGLGDSWNSGRDYAAKILTGDQNMSGRRMSRGARHLRRMGIDTPYANQLKQDMYDAQTEKNRYDGLLQRASNSGWNGLSGDEQSQITAGYRNWLSDWNKNHPHAHKSFDQAELERDGAALAADWAASNYGIKKSKYDKVEGMQKVYGQARSYEAQYEGEDGRYTARNFTNRAFGGLGHDHSTSRVQQWRSQKFDDQGATSATNPTGVGVDWTPPGSMGEGSGGPHSS